MNGYGTGKLNAMASRVLMEAHLDLQKFCCVTAKTYESDTFSASGAKLNPEEEMLLAAALFRKALGLLEERLDGVLLAGICEDLRLGAKKK